jgi:hypothetical protein
MLPALSLVAQQGRNVDLKDHRERTMLESGFIRRIVSSYAEADVEHIDNAELIRIVKRTPCVSAFIAVARAYIFSLTNAHMLRIKAGNTSPAAVRTSDFGDLMHSFYAPYFDIFRCDARFGALLKEYAPIRSNVADRRSDIVRMLSEINLDK